MANASEWYYAKNGESNGPISSAELKELAHRGAIKPTDYVRRGSQGNWSKAAKVNGLLFDLAGPPTLPPQAADRGANELSAQEVAKLRSLLDRDSAGRSIRKNVGIAAAVSFGSSFVIGFFAGFASATNSDDFAMLAGVLGAILFLPTLVAGSYAAVMGAYWLWKYA